MKLQSSARRSFATGMAALAALLNCGGTGWAAGRTVATAAGSVPLMADVDVVVIGGSSAGVAAAAEAAKAGAKVFLAAAQPYLGQDLCGTGRIWLEPGETPDSDLARALFAFEATPTVRLPANALSFTYRADVEASPKHAETRPPGRLTDGRWKDATKDSVQYDGDVTLTLDLGGEQPVEGVTVLAFQRPADFELARISVEASRDGQTWTPVGAATNESVVAVEDEAVTVAVRFQAPVRQLRVHAAKKADSTRLLLGEVLVHGPEGAPAAAEPGAVAKAVVAPRPMQIKKALDRALIDAGVPFLYASYPAGILRDAQGAPAGVVIVNRSGPQAIRAKVIIDATPRAAVARLAGASATAYPAGPRTFRRVVVGGAPVESDGAKPVPRAGSLTASDAKGRPILEYDVTVPMRDGSFPSFAEAEQRARDLTWTTQVVDAAETLFEVPPDVLRCRAAPAGAWPGAAKADLDAFRTSETPALFVLGGCAGVSREAAAAMLRPLEMLALGARIGRAAADEAKRRPATAAAQWSAAAGAAGAVPGVTARFAPAPPRFDAYPRVPAPAGALPVIGDYDVVVVGGGTGGGPAGIGAARAGARTLVIEFLHGLGGVSTLGYIGSYYHGNRVGFTTEMDEGVAAWGGAGKKGQSWDVEHKSEWMRREIRKAGGHIWYGAIGAGAVVQGGYVRGVIVATPDGPGVVLAKTVIDATGNADVAAAAGAACVTTDGTEPAVQGTGLPPHGPGENYNNTDYIFVDETDVVDVWRAFVTAKEVFAKNYDLGQLVDTRERRRIVGDVTLTPMDFFLNRTHPDTLVVAKSNFDSHGFTTHPLFFLRPPGREGLAVDVPLSCMLPKGIEGLLVTGLGVSAQRDAVPVIRMQPDIQNQGYAAGRAAAMSARDAKPLRALDVKALQRHLIEIGVLPDRVLTDKDSLPLPAASVREAVESFARDGRTGLEVILTQPDDARPMLKAAYAKTEAVESKLAVAHVLGMLGDATGVETLADAVRDLPLEEGWNYRGMGQFGPSVSPADSLMIALGRARDPRGLEPILEKARTLTPTNAFSHFRAVSLACEALGDRRAAPVLADLLALPGVGGHAVTNLATALANPPTGRTDNEQRNRQLIELSLARALYRCGDHEGLGERTLRAYANDLTGHYARHAKAVLDEKKGGR